MDKEKTYPANEEPTNDIADEDKICEQPYTCHDHKVSKSLSKNILCYNVREIAFRKTLRSAV